MTCSHAAIDLPPVVMRSREKLVSASLPFYAWRPRLTSRNDSQSHWGWRSIAGTLALSPAAPTHFLDKTGNEAAQQHDGKSATGDGQCCVGRDAYFLVDREQEKGQEGLWNLIFQAEVIEQRFGTSVLPHHD